MRKLEAELNEMLNLWNWKYTRSQKGFTTRSQRRRRGEKTLEGLGRMGGGTKGENRGAGETRDESRGEGEEKAGEKLK
jgi:hypothetical protein